jgi:hypothetical protein
MANKAQLISRLAIIAGITTNDATAAIDNLPEALGEWMREDGNNGNGTYSGAIEGGLEFEMTRQPNPPQFNLVVSASDDFLTDFGNGSTRFGLQVK